MRFHPKLTVLLALALATAGCATRQNKAPMPYVPERKPTVVGKVSLVNSSVGFVLIDSRAPLIRGTTLQTLDANERPTAKLLLTPVQQPPFLIADIISGSPYPGENVIVAELPKATESAPIPSRAPVSATAFPSAPSAPSAPVAPPAPIEVDNLTPEVAPPPTPDEETLPTP